MKFYLSMAAVLALLLYLILATVAHGNDRPVPIAPGVRAGAWWLDLDRGMAQAQRVHRPVMLYFAGRQCSPCREMDWILRAPRARWLPRRYVLIRLWYEDEPKLGERYNVLSLPTFILMDSAGREARRQIGYAPPDRFHPWAGEPRA